MQRVIEAGYRWRAVRRYAREARALPAPPTGAGKPLVVLLHGYGGDAREFFFLYDHLHPRLRERCDFLLPNCLLPSMLPGPEDNADRLRTYLEAHGLHERPLYLVGHSVGGLIARCFLHRAAGRVRALVCTGTPNGGINAWNPLPIHWMRSAGFDARFNAVYPPPQLPTLLIAGTRGNNLLEGLPNDRVVGAWSVMRWPHPAAERRHYPLDHWELLNNAAVAEEIAQFLKHMT